MQTDYSRINAETIRPLSEAVALGLRAIRIARTRPLPDAEFAAARKAFYTKVKPRKPKPTKTEKDTP